MPGATLRLSLVVVNWNTRELLASALESLRRTVRSKHETIVVDNGSTDGSAELVAREFPECILIRNSRNLGYSEANNQAIRRSRAPILVLLNSDIEAEPGAIDGMADHLDAHPQVGALSPKLVYPDGRLQRFCRRFPTFATLLIENSSLRFRAACTPYRDRLLMSDWDFETERDVAEPGTSCLLVRRRVLDEVGLFDQGCRLLYNDVDLCKRIRAAEFRIRYLPAFRIVHHQGASVRRFPRLAEEVFRNSHRYVRKHYGPWLGWLYSVLVVGDALRQRQCGWTRFLHALANL